MSANWPHSIARRIVFGGPQSNYFGVEPARAEAMRGGEFVGDTRQGGSCNADVITLNPHCHGTHTEGVGHIVEQAPDVYDAIPLQALSALLVTLSDTPASRTADRCPESTAGVDRVLTAKALRAAIGDERLTDFEALIVRTLPNEESKQHRHYTDSGDYPFFTHSALQLIVDAGIEHLLIDTPSLDRLDDGGALALHRQFWQLPRTGHSPSTEMRASATITEMIYVEPAIADGRWQIMLQAVPFSGNAVPCNPVLFIPDVDTC